MERHGIGGGRIAKRMGGLVAIVAAAVAALGIWAVSTAPLMVIAVYEVVSGLMRLL